MVERSRLVRQSASAPRGPRRRFAVRLRRRQVPTFSAPHREVCLAQVRSAPAAPNTRRQPAARRSRRPPASASCQSAVLHASLDGPADESGRPASWADYRSVTWRTELCFRGVRGGLPRAELPSSWLAAVAQPARQTAEAGTRRACARVLVFGPVRLRSQCSVLPRRRVVWRPQSAERRPTHCAPRHGRRTDGPASPPGAQRRARGTHAQHRGAGHDTPTGSRSGT